MGRGMLTLLLVLSLLGCDKFPGIKDTKKADSAQKKSSTVPLSGMKGVKTTSELQKALRQAGYYKGPIDGRFSAALRKSLMDFQRASGLVVDGKVGPKTRAKLRKFIQ